MANSTFSCQRPPAACLLHCSERPKKAASGVPGRTRGGGGAGGLVRLSQPREPSVREADESLREAQKGLRKEGGREEGC